MGAKRRIKYLKTSIGRYLYNNQLLGQNARKPYFQSHQPQMDMLIFYSAEEVTDF